MDYHVKLTEFLTRLNADQKKAAGAKGSTPDILAYAETGRKFDKVIVKVAGNALVRYFIEKSTGKIYGAKSRFAPNLQWYFGDLERCHLWDWSDFHGVPVNDPDIRVSKSYGGYHHYINIKEI